MTVYIANAIAIGMLPDGVSIIARTLPVKEVRIKAAMCAKAGTPWHSIVGHEDTAAVYAEQLGVTVRCNRESVTLKPGDTVYVGQLAGGRLPPGATSLPKEFSIVWRQVDVGFEEEDAAYEII